jgi:hypothetical protein
MAARKKEIQEEGRKVGKTAAKMGKIGKKGKGRKAQ